MEHAPCILVPGKTRRRHVRYSQTRTLATRILISQHGNVAEEIGKAIRHIAEVFPSDDYANRAVWRAYLPHALRLLGNKQDCDVKERSELCLLVGRCLRVDGRVQEAGRWLEETCR